MNKAIIEHLFEFWSEIGRNCGFFIRYPEFYTTHPGDGSWPSKVYGLQPNKLSGYELFHNIKQGKLPNSVAIAEKSKRGGELVKMGFQLSSKVSAMALNKPFMVNDDQEAPFVQVDSNKLSGIFAKIASESFGYQVLVSTVIPLQGHPRMKLFLGKFDNEFVSCGILYVDQKGASGIHMIGTLPDYRGLGLGKKMTQKLISEVKRNGGNQCYLVASEAGKRIYSKMGFKTYGNLESYTIQ